MKMVYWCATILLVFAATARATVKKSSVRQPASEAYEMHVLVTFGDRSTRFLVKSSGTTGILKTANDSGKRAQKNLDQSEVELLLQTFKKLPSNQNVPDSCYRSKIEIIMTMAGRSEEKANCFGVSSDSEASFRHFANLLAQPF